VRQLFDRVIQPESRTVKIKYLARTLVPLAMLAMLASGCGRTRDVRVHEPGVYEGARYTLQFTPELNAKLRQRVEMGQTDR
jgi:hypothetical protein